MDNITELFCLIDDFCRLFEQAWERYLLTSGAKKRRRRSKLSLSELITLARTVSSTALPPVQELLPMLRVPPSARRIPEVA